MPKCCLLATLPPVVVLLTTCTATCGCVAYYRVPLVMENPGKIAVMESHGKVLEYENFPKSHGKVMELLVLMAVAAF